MRTDDWRALTDNPDALPADIRAHLEAENAYTEAVLAPAQGLRADILAGMRARIEPRDPGVPRRYGAWDYVWTYPKDANHPSLRRRALGGASRFTTLLDGEREARGQAYFNISAAKISPDHKLLAWACDLTGGERHSIRIRSLKTGRDLFAFESMAPDLAWSADSQTIYGVALDANLRPAQALAYRLASPKTPLPLYTEEDAGVFVSLEGMRAGGLVAIAPHDHDSSALWLVDTSEPEPRARLYAPRIPGRELGMDYWQEGKQAVVWERSADAPDGTLVLADVAAAYKPRATLVPHEAGRVLLDFYVNAGHLAWLEMRDAQKRALVATLPDIANPTIIAPKTTPADLRLIPPLDSADTSTRWAWSSMARPEETWDMDALGQRRLARRRKVPTYRASSHKTWRVDVAASDGAQIPVSLLCHRDTPLDGSAPLLLYAYGAYGISIPPAFAPARVGLTERGFIYAIAHVRGGRERGQAWRDAGRRGARMTTFTDALAVAHDLIARGITHAGGIVVHGASAGGSLAAAVRNLAAPGLLGGVIAEVPFVDALNTMLDASLPLTPIERPEWGDPIADAQARATIAAWSPYDNIPVAPAPWILATGGLTDPRVTYWEPAKWIAATRAKAQAAEAQGLGTSRPIMLKMDMQAGHGGAPGRYGRLDDLALAWTFAIMATKS